MDNKVNIFLRIRPIKAWEAASPLKSFINYDKSTDQMIILEDKPYGFDKVFYADANNAQVFESVVST
jgi:hypothetical protein